MTLRAFAAGFLATLVFHRGLTWPFFRAGTVLMKLTAAR